MAVLGCRERAAMPPEPAPPAVTVQLPERREIAEYREYTGRTDAVESVDIRARVRGFLKKIHFREGAEVKKGDLLYEIDPREFQAAVEQNQATVRQREAELTLARSEADRVERMRATNAVSEEEYVQRISALKAAEAALAQAHAALDMSRLQLGFTRIEAPIAGRISRTLVTEGNLVGYNEPTLLTNIVRLEPMYVYFDVPERDFLEYQTLIREQGVASAAQGTLPLSMGLTNEKGYPHKGTIDFRGNRADTGTGTVTVRGETANPQRLLLPGLFARVRVPFGKPRERLLVPQAALSTDQRGPFLLIAGSDDVVEHRYVQTGIQQGELVEITEGLRPDDRVITNGLQFARPGSRVQPTASPAGSVK